MGPEKRPRCLGRGVRDDSCPECFRTFPQSIDGTGNLILDTSCVFCQSWILYAIVEPRSLEFPKRFQPDSPFALRSTPAVQLSD